MQARGHVGQNAERGGDNTGYALQDGCNCCVGARRDPFIFGHPSTPGWRPRAYTPTTTRTTHRICSTGPVTQPHNTAPGLAQQDIGINSGAANKQP